MTLIKSLGAQRTPSLRRNPSNIVAVNLSLSDLLYCLQWPSVIYCSMTQSTWLLEINFGEFERQTTTTTNNIGCSIVVVVVDLHHPIPSHPIPYNSKLINWSH